MHSRARARPQARRNAQVRSGGVPRGAAPLATSPWLYGPATDLLLGCGLGYALLVGVLALLPVAPQEVLRWGTLATVAIGMPHYGATLLRVYESSDDRHRYALFAIWASVAIWLLFAAGVRVPLVGSLLVTLYFNWSPWHYAGQNYGLALMCLRRRQIAFDAATKRALYASFLLSFVLSFLTVHVGDAHGYVPVNPTLESTRALTLGIPRPLFETLFPITLVANVATLLFAGVRLARSGALRDLLPAAALVATQAVWFTLPATILWWTRVRVEQHYVAAYFLWAAIGHAIQYLWVTTYYATGSSGLRSRVRFLGKSLLAGGLVFALPPLVFAPQLLGTLPYETGLVLLVAAAVNLQHFVLDGAIWKLRDGRVARILLAAPDPARSERVTGVGAMWLRRGVWSVATAATLLFVAAALEYELGWITATERADHARAGIAERRLVAIGRDNPLFYHRRAQLAAAEGDAATAMDEYRRSIAFYPTADAWYALGMLQARTGDLAEGARSVMQSLEIEATPEGWSGLGAIRQALGDREAAGDAFQRALDLDSDHVPSLRLAGRYLLEEGQRERARVLLERAVQLAPSDASLRDDLERAGG